MATDLEKAKFVDVECSLAPDGHVYVAHPDPKPTSTKGLMMVTAVVMLVMVLVGGLAGTAVWRYLDGKPESSVPLTPGFSSYILPHHMDQENTVNYVKKYHVHGEDITEVIEMDTEQRIERFDVPDNGHFQRVTVIMDFARNLTIYKDYSDRMCFLRPLEPELWPSPEDWRQAIVDIGQQENYAEESHQPADRVDEMVVVAPEVTDLQLLVSGDVVAMCENHRAFIVMPVDFSHHVAKRSARKTNYLTSPWSGGKHSIKFAPSFTKASKLSKKHKNIPESDLTGIFKFRF
ncbi:uncharacterized protein LOC144859903 [Branchiostoma floridae x Branchiostoma japonicum]